MKTDGHFAAVVLAAGLGTRMKSSRPKVLHELAGRPLIHYPLGALRRLGVERLVVVVGHGAEEVKAACAGFDALFAVQAEQRGTGHALRCGLSALEGFHGPIMSVYGDLPLLSAETLGGLLHEHRKLGAALSILTATVPDPTGYGRIIRENGGVRRVVEQRDATPDEAAVNEVNVGIYTADADFLREVLPRLRPNNAQGELYLTDIVGLAIEAGKTVADAQAPLSEVAQVNWRGELAQMEKTLRDSINRGWMEAGVTLIDPDTTYIEADVEIGRETVIGPNVQLRGATQVGAGCRFDGSAYISNACIGDAAHIKFGVVVTDSEIGPRCEIGPFANIRNDTKLDEGVAIGDFVETKKAHFGPRAKARHLSYLGDAEIGGETNIGAGTITCNYDGFHKHQTIIGSRVMIGSDTQLVAPVTVGDDAYVASGTTVMKDVPAGALAFNSKNQLNRPGWVAARRAREGGDQKPAAAPAAKKPARRVRKTAAAKARVAPRKGAARKRAPR